MAEGVLVRLERACPGGGGGGVVSIHGTGTAGTGGPSRARQTPPAATTYPIFFKPSEISAPVLKGEINTRLLTFSSFYTVLI